MCDLLTSAVTEAVGNIVEKWEMTYRALEHLIDDTRPNAGSANSEEAQEDKPAPTDDKVQGWSKILFLGCVNFLIRPEAARTRNHAT